MPKQTRKHALRRLIFLPLLTGLVTTRKTNYNSRNQVVTGFTCSWTNKVVFPLKQGQHSVLFALFILLVFIIIALFFFQIPYYTMMPKGIAALVDHISFSLCVCIRQQMEAACGHSEKWSCFFFFPKQSNFLPNKTAEGSKKMKLAFPQSGPMFYPIRWPKCFFL